MELLQKCDQRMGVCFPSSGLNFTVGVGPFMFDYCFCPLVVSRHGVLQQYKCDFMSSKYYYSIRNAIVFADTLEVCFLGVCIFNVVHQA
jgi:hypothetical protein